jgi:outer membrane protein OmpA-like peptidoglycan-associated protein
MKKSTILSLVCALFLGQSAVAQNQEVTYVEDPSQGYLLNSFSDNWFITAEGGAGVYFTSYDGHRKFTDRFAPAAGLYVGKWFSPIIGLRAGGNLLFCKGLSQSSTAIGAMAGEVVDGSFYKQRFLEVGPVADVMLNLTNWWCGYHPGRVYNAIFYAGGGLYWTYAKGTDSKGLEDGWEYANDRVLTLRAGLINQFNIGKHWAISLDLRASAIDQHNDRYGDGSNRTAIDLQAYLGVTYKFNKTEWSAPVVPVCPEAENCDALRARLASADARIADLESQLRDCLNRPAEQAASKAPLATIYYPINVSKLTKVDEGLLDAVSNVMKSNPDQKYTLTGWADNYTGNDQINTRLRNARVNGVANQLKKNGVSDSQLNVTINNGNLCDLGDKYVALDRAVTIEEAE